MMTYPFGIIIVGAAFGLRVTEAILCYKCSDGDASCPVTSSATPTEECTGFCQTRVQWKFRETVRYVNISRSCVPSCYDRSYLYGYFDSVEDICCGDDLCNRHTKPSKYSKCHYCSGDGKNTCRKDDYVTISTESLIYCVGECKKLVSEGKYEGEKVTSLERTCDDQCSAGVEDLLDPYGNERIGTKTTYCCSGDLCNTGTPSGGIPTWLLAGIGVALIQNLAR